MENKIFRNSYVIFGLSFVALYVLFYLLGIGLQTEIGDNGKPVVKSGWRYPLGLSIIVWVFWHFYMYPPPDVQLEYIPPETVAQHGGSGSEADMLGGRAAVGQRINMKNWY